MKERRALLVLVDFGLVNLAVLFALAIWAVRGQLGFDLRFLLAQFYWFILLSILWLGFATLNGLYDLPAISSIGSTVAALLRTAVWAVAGYFAIYFLSPPNSLPRLVVFYHGAGTVALLLIWRVVYGGLLSRAPFRRHILIVGAGQAGRAIAATIRENLDRHYQLVGFIDDEINVQGQVVDGLPVLGSHAEMLDVVKRRNVAEVVLAVTRDLSPGLFRSLLDAQEQGIEITPMPVLYEQITGRVPVDHVGDSWYVALPLGHAATGSLYPVLKRALDLVVAVVGLVVLGVLLPFLALAVRLDSHGPLFYSQERVGKGGRVFRVRKFRTMVSDAEQGGKAIWASRNDPRVTRVGRVLRMTRIDEFPQFINILLGEMSAVGPRPERPEFVCKLEQSIPFYRLRHAVKPGMAGWAVVNFGYIDSPETAHIRVEYDLYYIKHQSIGLDILILFRTLGQVMALKGR